MGNHQLKRRSQKIFPALDINENNKNDLFLQDEDKENKINFKESEKFFLNKPQILKKINSMDEQKEDKFIIDNENKK